MDLRCFSVTCGVVLVGVMSRLRFAVLFVCFEVLCGVSLCLDGLEDAGVVCGVCDAACFALAMLFWGVVE